MILAMTIWSALRSTVLGLTLALLAARVIEAVAAFLRRRRGIRPARRIELRLGADAQRHVLRAIQRIEQSPGGVGDTDGNLDGRAVAEICRQWLASRPDRAAGQANLPAGDAFGPAVARGFERLDFRDRQMLLADLAGIYMESLGVHGAVACLLGPDGDPVPIGLVAMARGPLAPRLWHAVSALIAERGAES